VQRLAHAVQALELEAAVAVAARHLQHGRDGVGVVGGELRIDPVGHASSMRAQAM
jgi:hypothetical protein